MPTPSQNGAPAGSEGSEDDEDPDLVSQARSLAAKFWEELVTKDLILIASRIFARKKVTYAEIELKYRIPISTSQDRINKIMPDILSRLSDVIKPLVNYPAAKRAFIDELYRLIRKDVPESPKLKDIDEIIPSFLDQKENQEKRRRHWDEIFGKS